MTSANVRIIIKDPIATGGEPQFECVKIRGERFRDGPMTDRVVVVDSKGAVSSPVRFVPPESDGEPGQYHVADPKDLDHSDFLQTNVFGTVYKVLEMFEEKDTLARQVAWAFDAPQLRVMPDAGPGANARYERELGCVRFFSYRPVGGKTVHTACCQDIVAHETAHAILDGIAPDLYDSISPQSLALHEAIADLTGLMMGLRARELKGQVIHENNGSLPRSNSLTDMGVQLARAMENSQHAIRDLAKKVIYDSGDHRLRTCPHQLSLVLSTALYSTLSRHHKQVFDTELVIRLAKEGLSRDSDCERSREIRRGTGHFAVGCVGPMFKRVLYRALDYLPPGDASFADFARAILAADRASHPGNAKIRTLLRRAFVEHGVVDRDARLATPMRFSDAAKNAVAGLDLDEIVDEGDDVRKFVDENRSWLNIPDGTPFTVRGCLSFEKEHNREKKSKTVRECLIKIAWHKREPNHSELGWEEDRLVKMGTTLAIDWTERKIRAVIATEDHPECRVDRDFYLMQAQVNGDLRRADEMTEAERKSWQGIIAEKTSDGALRFYGGGRGLHALPEE